MNFKRLKPIVAALLSVFCFVFVLIVSCEKNPCDNQSCQHGGSCGNGICTCPLGYDGPSCENRTVNRFLGVYANSTYCDGGAPVIDTAWVIADTASGPNNVKFVMYTNIKDTLSGVCGLNQSVWAITIPSEYRTNYFKNYTVTLQSTNKLSVFTYSDDKTNPLGEVTHNCYFIGTICYP